MAEKDPTGGRPGGRWTGERLPGDTGLPEPGAAGAPAAPAPPAAPPAPVLSPPAGPQLTEASYAPSPIDALIPEESHATFEMLVVINGVQLEARGASFDEALDALRTQWAAQQEPAPSTLVWDTGRLVEDDDLRLIAEALELYEETHGKALPPSVRASMARLRKAVGE